jgi:hypothetical protein
MVSNPGGSLSLKGSLLGMAQNIESMIVHCLSNHTDIVPWLRGSVHPDMVEYPPEFLKMDNLARRGGTYRDSQGTICAADMSLLEYRDTLNAAVMARDASVEWTEAKVSEVLYPKAMAKARADRRSRLDQQAQALLGKAMLLWPAPDVRDLMSLDIKLTSAVETVDLIAFVNALKEFCLEGSGNVDNNIRVAEDTITNLRMGKNRFTAFIKDFKAAAENLISCGSNFTQERVISLLMKNLDQSVFVNFHINYLDVNHHLNALRLGTLQDAITVVHQYYNSVIRVVEDDSSTSTIGGGVGSHNHSVVKVGNAKGLKEALSTSSTSSDYVVSHAVLAAFVRSASKVGEKRKGTPSLGVGKSDVSGVTLSKRGKCFYFEKGEDCKFGAKCKFAHH